MAHSRKYKPQQHKDTCGAATIRNCLIALGHSRIPSENTILRIAKIKREDGMDDDTMMRVFNEFGYGVSEIRLQSSERFRKRIIEGLKLGKVYAVVTDALQHWVPAIGYENRKIWIVDKGYKEVPKPLSVRDFLVLAHNVDRQEFKRYYSALEIQYPLPY